MFNYLVSGHYDSWKDGMSLFSRSRFLEYTSEDIASAFKVLKEEQIEALKSYPCLFAYEGVDDSYYIGKFTKIEDRGSTIYTEFEIDWDNPIEFSKIDKIRISLDIRDWEIHRSHWAIKKADLFEYLKKQDIPTSKLWKRPKKAKIPRTRDEAKAITSVGQFINKILGLQRQEDTELFYRGHIDRQNYKLEPSLFRRDQNGNYLYLEKEHLMFQELLVSNSADFETDIYTLDKLVRMQHYSLPTRLLDITSNPLIALYFACSSNNPLEKTIDGEVIIFTIERKNIKYFDSDTVSCIANLARLPQSQKDAIDFSLPDNPEEDPIEKFNDQTPIKRLHHFICEEKSFFEARLNPEDLRRIICIKAKKTNDRITSQAGAFLVFGHEAVLNDDGNDTISVQRMTIQNKYKILEELNQLDINESTVFPYIENSAKYIAKKFRHKEKQDY